MDSLKYSIIWHHKDGDKTWYASNKKRAIELAKQLSNLAPSDSITVQENWHNGIIYEIVK